MGKPTFDNSYCDLSQGMKVLGLRLHYELSKEGIKL
jgi:hypothetical protein